MPQLVSASFCLGYGLVATILACVMWDGKRLEPILKHVQSKLSIPLYIKDTKAKLLPNFDFALREATNTRNADALRSYRLVDDYAEWHAKNRYSGKKLVWRCARHVCGGLGDRFRGIVLAYLYAVVTERVFLIDWSDPYPLQKIFSPNRIDWRYNAARDRPSWETPDEVLSRKAPFPMISTTADPQKLLQLPNDTLIVSERNIATLSRVLKACNSRLCPLLKHSRPAFYLPLFHRMILKALLKPSRALQSQERFIKHKLRLKRPYLGIHARLGAGVNEEGRFAERFSAYLSNMRATAAQLTTAILERKKEENVTGGCSVFLATDTPSIHPLLKKELRTRDPSIKLVRAVKKPRHFTDRSKSPDKNVDRQAFLDAMLDIQLLAGAQSLIHLRSGFADLAFWLSSAEKAVIVKWSGSKEVFYKEEYEAMTFERHIREELRIQTIATPHQLRNIE